MKVKIAIFCCCLRVKPDQHILISSIIYLCCALIFSILAALDLALSNKNILGSSFHLFSVILSLLLSLFLFITSLTCIILFKKNQLKRVQRLVRSILYTIIIMNIVYFLYLISVMVGISVDIFKKKYEDYDFYFFLILYRGFFYLLVQVILQFLLVMAVKSYKAIKILIKHESVKMKSKFQSEILYLKLKNKKIFLEDTDTSSYKYDISQ